MKSDEFEVFDPSRLWLGVVNSGLCFPPLGILGIGNLFQNPLTQSLEWGRGRVAGAKENARVCSLLRASSQGAEKHAAAMISFLNTSSTSAGKSVCRRKSWNLWGKGWRPERLAEVPEDRPEGRDVAVFSSWAFKDCRKNTLKVAEGLGQLVPDFVEKVPGECTRGIEGVPGGRECSLKDEKGQEGAL